LIDRKTAGERMDIVTELRDRILRIQINRPQKKNALTVDMYAAMADALESAERNPDVRVVLIHGNSEMFTAGNDIVDFDNAGQTEGTPPVYRFLHDISTATKPLVAVVTGPAVGIGTTMLLHCDLVYAGQNARFTLPFVNLGLCPEAASSYLLPRLLGYQRAAELLMLGDPFSAGKAREFGIVTEVLPDADVFAYAEKQARRLADKPPASLRVTKQLMKVETGSPVKQAMLAERVQFSSLLFAPEAKEAFKAFFEKRKPDFSGFR
jgi:enoyl-CoA hydratase/carnithine racemase